VAAGLKVGEIVTQQSVSENAPTSLSTGSRRVTKTVPGPGQRIYDGQSVNLEVTP